MSQASEDYSILYTLNGHTTAEGYTGSKLDLLDLEVYLYNTINLLEKQNYPDIYTMHEYYHLQYPRFTTDDPNPEGVYRVVMGYYKAADHNHKKDGTKLRDMAPRQNGTWHIVTVDTAQQEEWVLAEYKRVPGTWYKKLHVRAYYIAEQHEAATYDVVKDTAVDSDASDASYTGNGTTYYGKAWYLQNQDNMDTPLAPAHTPSYGPGITADMSDTSSMHYESTKYGPALD